MVLFEDAFIAFCAITLTAIFYSLVSGYISRTWGNRARAKAIQEEMTHINKMAQEAAKSGDTRKQKEAEELQGKIPKLLQESMILNFKPLVFTLPMFIVTSWALRQLFPNFVITLGVYLPIFIQNLENFPNWRNEFGVVGWFVISLLFCGMFIQFVGGKIEAWKKKRK